ncbi:urease accessory protein UreE [Corynebacterium vitaeruminis]|uniref:Urease accessory protein UreE n=1 Tax=Corynebacterium vitaeruminis DSM 20294 TaxID=1224164 RepID=W5XY48_9CORY|nr:urease accessory protein UreE [Corynebacterium vitaeruminis]AHI21624.1 urease accessory protein UreE [Corynebacterium vitaeruminis DSM 20294]
MIFTDVLGNESTPAGEKLLADHHIERLLLDDHELRKRILRATTDHGTEVGVRLPAGAAPLADGDILYLDDHNAIVVRVNPTDVLIIRPTTLKEMGFVAHSLGNRHLPAQFYAADSGFDPEGADCMVVQYDHTVEDFLAHHGVAYSRESKVTPEPFRHVEHTH